LIIVPLVIVAGLAMARVRQGAGVPPAAVHPTLSDGGDP